MRPSLLRRLRSTVAFPPPSAEQPSPLSLGAAVLLCVAPLGWCALQHGPHAPPRAAARPPPPPWGDAALASLGLPAAASDALSLRSQEGVRRAFLGWSSALLAALGAAHAGAVLAAAPARLPLHRLRVAAAAGALLVGGASAAAAPAAGPAAGGALRRHHALMAAHLALHAAEEALARARPPAFPGWYMHARTPITACVVVAHAVAAYLGADASVADSDAWERKGKR